MIQTLQASELAVGMFVGFCKIRQIVAIMQVENGDVYARYETLGLFPRQVRMPAKQKIQVRISHR